MVRWAVALAQADLRCAPPVVLCGVHCVKSSVRWRAPRPRLCVSEPILARFGRSDRSAQLVV